MRVVIADDSALVREGVARILAEAGMEVAGTFADGGALESRVEQIAPDVAILDIRMPPTFTDEGVRLAARLREVLPALAILLLSQQGKPGERALSSGALLRERGGAGGRSARLECSRRAISGPP